MIDISNVVNISVSTPPATLAEYSINNLAVFTKDTPPGADAYYVYTNATDVLTDWGDSSKAYAAAVAVFSQSPNIMTGGGKLIVVPVAATGVTLTEAITAVKDSVYFGACGHTWANDDTEVTAAATYCQSIRRMLFVASATAADLTTGLLADLQAASLTHARCLYHSDSAQLEAWKWGYAGRAMSTNFAGSNTTQTMHLKQIVGVTADTGITSTVLSNAQAAGVDVYVSIAGRASVFTSGENGFFDDIFNLNWIVGSLEVAGFNLLAGTSTKIPQTEEGMLVLKAAYQTVCDQAVTNRFVGPGSWTSADTFGDPQDFNRAIGLKGYFLYSSPVALQSAADRASRKAPLVQIALKYQGAVHSTSVIIFVNK